MKTASTFFHAKIAKIKLCSVFYLIVIEPIKSTNEEKSPYTINPNGKITYAFLDADYRNRAEPSEITKVLHKMKK